MVTTIIIIAVVLFFLYNKGKKIQEQEAQKRQGTGGTTTTTSTTYSGQSQKPRNEKTIDEILRELQQQVDKANKPAPKPVEKKQPVFQPATTTTYQTYEAPKPKDVLVHERKTSVKEQEEGKSAYEPVYERELTDEEKIERGNLKLQNEGAYKIEEEVEKTAFIFDPQQALISSVILERLYK